MEIKHSRNIKSYLLTLCIIFLCGSVSAFEIDWDGSLGEGEHDTYVPALSNPLFNETPYITTEIRPVFIHQDIPGSSPIGGGEFYVIAAEIRVAITDRLGIIATKDGYANLDFDALPDETGFANISLGLKYAFYDNRDTQSIATVGIEYEPPSGSLQIDPLGIDLNEGGDGFINTFITGAKQYGKLGVQGSLGANFALDDDHDSSLLHYSLHTHYQISERIFPLIEINGFTTIDDASRTPFKLHVGDIVNLGTADGGTRFSAAGGVRVRAMDNLILGVGVEKPFGGREGLMDTRYYLDAILHF